MPEETAALVDLEDWRVTEARQLGRADGERVAEFIRTLDEKSGVTPGVKIADPQLRAVLISNYLSVLVAERAAK